MKLRPPEISIPEADPFQHDLLNRKGCAASLTTLLQSAGESLVVGVDAEWGQGKTTFLRMWRQQLKNEGVRSLYFNAWECDFSNDAFVSFMGEIELGMAELNLADRKKARVRLAAVKKIGLKIASRAVPTAVKVLTAGVLSADDFTEEAIADLGESIAQGQLDRYQSAKNSVSGFRAALSEFAHAVSAPADGGASGPLVIIIDELDRCRPSFAIDVLETVKHFFSVPGVSFVVAADWGQLENVVRSRYGLSVDVDGYLKRFTDFVFVLPKPLPSSFLDAQFDRYGFKSFFDSRRHGETQYDFDQVKKVFSILFEATSCTLRDQEKAFSMLGLAIRATPSNVYLHGILLAALIVLKLKNPRLYRQYSNRTSSHLEVIEYFSKAPEARDFLQSGRGYGLVLEAYLAIAGLSSAEYDRYVSGVAGIANSDSSSNADRERASRVLHLICGSEFQDNVAMLQFVTQKIDFASSVRS